MLADNNFIVFKELNEFTKNIQNYKNKILAYGLKTKFKDSNVLYTLENLSDLESNFYKKLALYYSADKEIDKEILIKTIIFIENQYQNLLSKYFFKT